MSSCRFSKNVLILHTSALCETIVAGLITVLAFDDPWKLSLKTCPVTRLFDFYTLFHNPSPQYKERLNCTQEAVYPLQTIVLVYYLLSLIMMVLVRPILTAGILKQGKSALYAALYFLPILSVVHCLFCGLICKTCAYINRSSANSIVISDYAFPCLSIIMGMVATAFHFAVKLDQKMWSLIKSTVTDLKNAVIIRGYLRNVFIGNRNDFPFISVLHWLILAYGIISLQRHMALLMYVPLPAIYYIITTKFTEITEMSWWMWRRLGQYVLD